jgi:hypothetical protein
MVVRLPPTLVSGFIEPLHLAVTLEMTKDSAFQTTTPASQLNLIL